MGERNRHDSLLEDDPLWYKNAVIYELHVRAFSDSTGDGVGDFRGLTQKLDYLHDLGVTAVWLLPFCPSPLKDDGYDMSDYTDVHPLYGTLADFEAFLREAHRRGIRVITELALNHTSDQHPWFQRARHAKPGSPWRDFYVWSDTPERYQEARIIFKDFESSNWAWDPVARAYYWHRFYSHQPDLNYDNPRVRKAIAQAVDFWFGLGVDGLRLDAVPYLFERERTNCENLPETHGFIKELRRHVDRKFKNKMFLAEANQWPEDAAAYFGSGDECHMNFHFPLMPRLFMAIHTEDRFPIIDILQQTPPIPETCQWGIFLRNHDELTLEMVTDEERDYMYRVYAQDPQARINLGIRRRLAPLLGNHRRRIELMNGLLFSLPGSPIIYYGDEIGMGDNVYLGDRNGVRTPMQWSGDRNAGFSRANPQRLYLPVIIDPEYHYEAVNVEAQQNNPHSLLWWMKRLIALRKRFKAFGSGTLELLHPENRKILAFLRRYHDECILVVANLSRFVQYVELDLSAFQGVTPVEMFGRVTFPRVGELPYLLTLGPHSFYWFTLEPRPVEAPVAIEAQERQVPTVPVDGAWERLFQGKARATLESVLPNYLRTRRWFGGKARPLRAAAIPEVVPFPYDGSHGAYLISVVVSYVDGDPETYVLPVTVATGEQAERLRKESPHLVIARLRSGEEEGVLYDALYEKGFCQALLAAIARRRRFKGTAGELAAVQTSAFRKLRDVGAAPLDPALSRAEQSNTSIVYGDQLILKLFRRVAQGVNPDLEIGRFLTEKVAFPHTPPVLGAFEYRQAQREPVTVGILHKFVPNQGDAWKYTLDTLDHYFEQALARRDVHEPPLSHRPLVAVSEEELPDAVREAIGSYLVSAQLLGQRTAEMHIALASGGEEPNFAPEPFSTLYQRSIYQSMRSTAAQSFQLLRRRLQGLSQPLREEAQGILAREGEVLQRFQAILGRKITAMRIRCHGDYHLGQVLHTGKDFVIIDFEGEPVRPLSERRIKRSPLRDVAGMIRSFHYAAYTALFKQEAAGGYASHPEAVATLELWARVWYVWVSATFLRTYREVASRAPFLPHTREELQVLMDAYLLEKAVYELGYELNNRPDWIRVPLRGIAQLLEAAG
ncbi:MAG: maltose alpha-D-glucosyltransferase [Thermodesulfobacteriota bacterium]|jgi:maltose alpha-D-glucosyltransferase/alpha-amylase